MNDAQLIVINLFILINIMNRKYSLNYSRTNKLAMEITDKGPP